MARLEELVVELVAETKGLRTELEKATKVTSKASDKMDNSIEQFSKNSSKNLTFFQTAMASAAGFIGSQLVLGAFNNLRQAAADLFNTFVTEGVQAAKVQEDAINDLNQQLALNGQFSAEASKDMQDYAKQLQSTTKFGDETILRMLSLASTFGKSREETKRLVEASTELAAATGMSLESAIKNLGKTYAGLTGELGESLPIIRTLTAEELKAGEAVNLLINRFGGSAAAQIKTFSGLQQQISNNFGDLTEQIGVAVTQNQALLNVMGEINKELMGVTGNLEDNNQGFKLFVAEGLVFLLDTGAVVLIMLDNLSKAFQTLVGAIQVATAPLAATTAAFIAMTQGVDAAREYLSFFANSVKENLGAFASDTETSLQRGAQKFSDLSVAAQKGADVIKSSMESTVEPTNQVIEKVAELSAAEQKRQEILKQFATTLADNTAALESNYNYELELLKANFDQKLLTEEEYLLARNDLILEYQEQEQANLEEAKAKGLITQQQYKAAIEALDKRQYLDRKKMATDYQKFEEKMNQLRMQGYGQFFQGLSSLQGASTKELAAIGKAAAITNATIDAYVAINKTMASLPFPANVAAAAGIGIQAFMNVSRIAGVGLNKGGTLVGGGANVDSIPAVLTKGETVVSRDLTNKLEEFLNSQVGGGQRNIVVEIILRDNLVDFIEAQIVERQNIGASRL